MRHPRDYTRNRPGNGISSRPRFTMAKSRNLAALRNKCAAVHNVALVAKNVEMAVLKARLSLGLRSSTSRQGLHADTAAAGGVPDHPQDAAE